MISYIDEYRGFRIGFVTEDDADDDIAGKYFAIDGSQYLLTNLTTSTFCDGGYWPTQEELIKQIDVFRNRQLLGFREFTVSASYVCECGSMLMNTVERTSVCTNRVCKLFGVVWKHPTQKLERVF